MVARQGFDAMMKGQGDVVTGWMIKMQIGDRSHHTFRHAGRAASQDGGAGHRNAQGG
jgi:hypothetical protein